jgi:antirestriction protein ArdC
MPRNFTTQKACSGVNVLLLWNEAQKRGYASNEWLTFKQADAAGAKVNRGAKGVMCVFYKMAERAAKLEADVTDEAGMVAVMKPFWLFNRQDISGLPEVASQVQAPEVERIQAIEEILSASRASIVHAGNKAYYNSASDTIHLPPRELFKNPAEHASTAIHELAHWTGSESRLARAFGKRFGDEAYSFEELVAEISSCFVMAELGLVQQTLQGHASYLQSWLKVLKADKTAIFSAAKHASAAQNLILSFVGRHYAEVGA